LSRKFGEIAGPASYLSYSPRFIFVMTPSSGNEHIETHVRPIGEANKRRRMNGGKTIGPLALRRIGETLRRLCGVPRQLPTRLSMLVAQLRRSTKEDDYRHNAAELMRMADKGASPAEGARLITLAWAATNEKFAPLGCCGDGWRGRNSAIYRRREHLAASRNSNSQWGRRTSCNWDAQKTSSDQLIGFK
jgi:hypothetical protein